MSKAKDCIGFAQGFHGPDRAGFIAELNGAVARGDVPSAFGRMRVQWAIRRAQKDLALAEGLTDRGIALRQAIAAERGTRIAWIALLVSVAAMVISVVVYIRPSV